MTKFSRRDLMVAAAATGAAATLATPAISQGKFPSRPITFVCPWGAGGGTDATARIVASLMEREYGQPVNVVNRTGGSGVVGHAAIATAPADGYTIGMVTVEIAMMHHQGLTDLTYQSYTPLALMNEDPPGVQVNSSAPWKTVKELADFIKANPGKLKASGTGQGGIWHLALVGWLGAMGLPANAVPWVPSNGAAPAMQDLAANGLDIVTCSVPEARAMLDAGRVKSLAIMADKRNPQFPTVPTLNETLGINYSVGAWRGIAGPKGMPEALAKEMTLLMKKISENKEFIDFMGNRGFGIKFADADGYRDYMNETDKKMAAAMKSAGLSKA